MSRENLWPGFGLLVRVRCICTKVCDCVRGEKGNIIYTTNTCPEHNTGIYGPQPDPHCPVDWHWFNEAPQGGA